LSYAPLASAQTNNAATAQALFEEARTLMAKGDYAAACKKLEGSQSLDPGPGTEFNLALCYEKSGKTASAWATYLSAATGYKTTNRPDWETRARARAAAMSGTLSRVTINGPAPPPKGGNVKILRDGKPVLESELGTALPVDPGHHVVEATADGHPKFTQAFDLAGPNGNQTINVVFAESSAGPSTSPIVTTNHSDNRKLFAYTLGGVGVAALGFGAIGGLIAINENDKSIKDCPNDGICTSQSALDANDSARTWSTISTVSLIAGSALLIAGVIVYFTAPKTSSTKQLGAIQW